MIDRRRSAECRRSGGKAAFVLRESIGIEHVLARQVLYMNECLRSHDSFGELVGNAAPIAFVGVRSRSQIFGAEIVALVPIASPRPSRKANSVGARRRPKNPGDRAATRNGFGKRIVLSLFLALRDGGHCCMEQCDLRRENVTK